MAEKVDNKNSDYNRDIYKTDRSSIDRSNRLLPRDPNKPSFQKVLDDTGSSADSNLPYSPDDQGTATETKEAVRQTASQQERDSGGSDNKDDFRRRLNNERERDRDEPSRPGESKESAAPRAKEAEKRVIGRGSTSERGEGGGEGHQSGGEGTGKQGQRGQRGFIGMPGGEMKGAGVKGEAKGIIHGSFEMELHAAQSLARTTSAQAPTKPLAANKALMDQIVQYCRVVTKTDGDKEIEMQLHEAVFKGLKLKVSINKDGKVVATFVTQSQEVSNLFNAQKAELKKALAEKGIAVESINVTMV